MQSIRRTAYAASLAVFAMTFAAGCTGGERNPSPSSTSVQKGQLGNGGFTFRCDDSVACDRWNNADNFPDAVALGSTFDMQFYLLDGTRGFSYLKEAERGTTTESVGKYINRGASGFAAVEPGIATIAARDSKGWLVDYITVRIRKPDSLIVYDSEYKGEDPTRIQRISIATKGDRKSYRVVAQAGVEALAGMVTVEWSSDDDSIVAVEGYSKGKVTIVATGIGSTKLHAKGASLDQELTVTVGELESTDAGTTDAATDAATDGGQQ
jgi:hypothetical protein